ncbi:MAG: 4-hydroxy-3-methylbut-2-enyl diphosphate reductase [Ignavibacteria bacterium]|nr:4-hydroxy-3-methylbut-2-enyl diphosphate reductase [Bacteroidota bacterium]MSQ46082.1 4-hydroxy-3-methylbut-2-enyl diphosphate reductase [Ignavibacteria bacterium]
MIITIDQHSGFCWGVVRTIEIAEQELESNKKLYSLGEIIHNPNEIKRLGEMGLQTIRHSDLENIKDAKILIRAHGEPPSTFKLASELGVEIIDATCPVVTKVQERIRKFYDKNYQIVIFGKKDHAEVIGLVGYTMGTAIVIKSVEEIDNLNLNKKTVLFSQTTMDKESFYAIRDSIKLKIKAEFEVGTFEETALDFHAKDTICGQVSGRDKKLREFSRNNDIVIFVSGKMSSNGKVLYSIAKEENEKTYFVENESELKAEWFKNVNSVGISGATSTPHWLMQRVKKNIEEREKEFIYTPS